MPPLIPWHPHAVVSFKSISPSPLSSIPLSQISCADEELINMKRKKIENRERVFIIRNLSKIRKTEEIQNNNYANITFY